nr:hypothetical protein [Tanacetum cinerariifolium]
TMKKLMMDMLLFEGTLKEGKSREKNTNFKFYETIWVSSYHSQYQRSLRTRIVEDNLHIRFSERTPNVVGSGPDWLFDIDALIRTLNYKPIVVGTKSNGFAEMEEYVNSTNNVNTVCSTVNAAGTNEVNAVGENISSELPFDQDMPALEDISTFNYLGDHEDDGEEADMNNLDTTIQNNPALTTRIHKDHPLDQVIGYLQSATQTRNMTKNLEEHGFVSTIKQRTNHKDL